MQFAFTPFALMARFFGPGAAARPRITRWYAARVPAGRTHELIPTAGRLTLHCRGGEAWITQDGVPKDILLNADQSYTADSTSRMIVHALQGDCVFEIQMED